jgi:polyisoprenyl-teichoic acid--peptidoglycan teichoic acid transferase
MTSRQLISHHKQSRHLPKTFEAITVLVFLFLVSLLGFILVAGLRSSNQPNLAYAYAVQTQTALNANPTPTPFQPETVGFIPETSSGVAPDTSQDLASTPEPGSTPVPTQRPLVKPEGQVNILLLGTDLREDDYGFRTDSITWISLNPKDGFVSAVSFPRDLYVQIPGRGENRINVAFQSGGFKTLADTMEINFGVRPDYYVLIHMNGFTTLINHLGGINVQTEQNLTDVCPRWINHSGTCSVGPGIVHMNADVALWYVRSRYSSSDVDRARRAQEVLQAIFKRLMSLDAVLKAPDLYNTYTSYIETDVGLSTVISLLPLAKDIHEQGDIRRYVVDFDYAYSWRTMTGASVLVPDKQAIQELMVEALQLR